MFKKSFVSLLIALFIMGIGGGILAGEGDDPVGPENPLYNAARGVEESQIDLVNTASEKAAFQNEFAERRMAAIENADYMAEADLEELLGDLNGHERALGLLLEGMSGPDAEEIIALVDEASKKRGEKLENMSKNENLPQSARDGMKRALENQEEARKKMADALREAQQKREAAGEQAQEGMERSEGAGEQGEDKSSRADDRGGQEENSGKDDNNAGADIGAEKSEEGTNNIPSR